MFPTIAGRALGLGALALALTGFAAPASARSLSVEVWTDRGDDAVYHPGESMQIKARTNDDAYLLVYEIDSDGRINVLYPWRHSSGQVEGRRTYHLPPDDSNMELAVEKDTGEGFIVALASRRPFRDLPWFLRPYDPQGESNGYEDRHDNVEGFDEDGRVVGDPMVAMERIRRDVLGNPGDDDSFATAYAQYYVGHEVRYPRYLCSDCHRPDHWAWWDGFDPYYSTCSVFDFRVNWNWAWGPTCWNGYVPYYYYVVRSDCPPGYRRWSGGQRWSSWDGWRTWNNLWGGNLTRYKSPPPPGYSPPAPHGMWSPSGTPPPGYISGIVKRNGERPILPVGRNMRPGGVDGPPPSRGEWRISPGNNPPRPRWSPDREPVRPAPRGDEGEHGSIRREPVAPAPTREEPRREPQSRGEWRQPAHRDPPRQEQPRDEGRHKDGGQGASHQGHGGAQKQKGGDH